MQIQLTNSDTAILMDARDKWGRQHELNMAMEECAETIAAVNHMSRGRDGSRERFVEEFADAIVCGMQIVENEELHFGLHEALLTSVAKLQKKLEADDKNHKEPQ